MADQVRIERTTSELTAPRFYQLSYWSIKFANIAHGWQSKVLYHIFSDTFGLSYNLVDQVGIKPTTGALQVLLALLVHAGP